MKCPVCKEPDLVMADRQGIEIDYCPRCRGVWLDRGELDKIIERSAGFAPGAPPAGEKQQYREHTEHRHHEGEYGKGYYKKKRGGFLDELFDFD
jgi:Zn-finger nucleic acid-binding protein